MTRPLRIMHTIGVLAVASLLLGAAGTRAAEVPIAVELRHLCDAVAGGVARLPALGRSPLITVAPLGGDGDRSTRELRRLLTDYLRVACLHDTHGFEVADMGSDEGIPSDAEARRARAAARGADVLLSGRITRGPLAYTVSLGAESLASGQGGATVLHPLPVESTDDYVRGILAPRTPAAAALRSAAFPGWGQIYNGQTAKGVILLSTELLLIGAATGFFVASLESDREYDFDLPETWHRRQDRERHEERALWALGLAGAVWAGAIVDAWLDGYRYDPERAFDRRGRIGPADADLAGAPVPATGVRLRWTGTGLVGTW